MRINIVSADSLGVRSLATSIETKDVKLIIDPAAALGPSRYNLPPHKIEIEALENSWKKIVEEAKSCSIIIITHYHFDHHNPDEHLEIFKDKIVYLKHPTQKVNNSQKQRAKYFIDKIKDIAKEVIYADGKEFNIGNTLIKFSEAVPHGADNKLGYVIEVLIKDDEKKFIFMSDVEGPVLEEQTKFVLDNCPNILLGDGPMTYMLGYKFSGTNLEKSINNLKQIILNCKPEIIILDHHLTRDIKWRERINPLLSEAENTKILCAAEFMNEEPKLLEAKRKELWKQSN